MRLKAKWCLPLLCVSSWGCFVVLSASTSFFHVPCQNGEINEEGTCECKSCWSGDDCSSYANSKPNFIRKNDVAYLSDVSPGQPIFTAEADDPDEALCKPSGECPCSTVTYSIASQYGESNFRIDRISGDVYALADFSPLSSRYKIRIQAADEDGNHDDLYLDIYTDKNDGPSNPDRWLTGLSDDLAFDHLLHRQKRSITLPSEVQFTLIKIGANENETEIRVGMRIEFRLDIVFPAGSTDMQVELFTPDTSTVVMMLCNVEVVRGGNLEITGSDVPTLESRDNSNIMDRAVIALGTVTNQETDLATETPSTFTVTYEAVMIENADTVDEAQYWVSAGAEFNNSRDIWVGQAKFTALTDDDSSTFTTTPDFNFTGPTELPIGASSLFLLDIMLPYPIIDIKVDIFAAINVSDAMSICSGKLMEVSEGYECGLGNLWDFEPQFHADGNTRTHGRVNWDLGKPINKLAREVSDVTQHKLSFGVIVRMEDDISLIGNDYVVGAAVEIGTDKIWAGQLTIRAIAKPSSSAGANPALNINSTSHTLSQNQPAEIMLDLEITELTSSEYQLEVIVPFQDGQSVLQICSLSVQTIGANLGCLESSAITSELLRSDPDSTLADRAIFTLGMISNVGTWGWYRPGEEATKNKLMVTVMVTGTDHTAASVGTKHNVTIGLHVGGDRMTVTSLEVEIVADSVVAAMSSENNPEFELFFNDGTDNLPIGSISRVTLEVTTKRNVIYEPFHVEFIMPNNTGTSMLSLCKVQLSSVGRNLPCLVKESVDYRTDLLSSFEDTIMDRSSIQLPFLCNKEVVNDTEEDKFRMEAVFRVLKHEGFDSSEHSWISGGVRYSEFNLWVGQISMTGDTTPQTYALDTEPHVEVVPSNSTWPGVPHGYPAPYLVRIKLNSNETTNMKLNVTTTSNALSICNIRMLRVGDGYYCMDYVGVMPVLDDVDITSGNIKRASFDLGVIKNFGENPIRRTSDFDENTIEMEVIVTMTTDAGLAPDQSTHSIEAMVIYDSVEQTVTAPATVKAVTDTSFIEGQLASGVTASAYKASISGADTLLGNETVTEIVLSESKRIVIELNTVASSVSKVSVTVSSPTGTTNVMNVEYIGVLDAGFNLPCVNSKAAMATYTPRADSVTNDEGNLLLPYACNTGANSTTEANVLRVEAIVRLMPFAAVSIDDVLTVNAAININDVEVNVLTTDFTVADYSDYIDIYAEDVAIPGDVGIQENTTESTIIMSIGEKKVIPVIFAVPSYTSSMIWFDAAMPANDSLGSALITVNDAVITRSGRNLPNLLQTTDMMTYRRYSFFNTSQMTKADVSLGVISNPGIRQRMGDYEVNDDTFTVEFTLQMADHDDSQDTSVHEISFGLHVAKYIFILEVPITVRRTNAETLVFNVSTSVDEVNSTASDVYVDSIVNLADTSSLEGSDSVFKLFIPPYLEYVDSVITTPYKQFTNVDKSKDVITFEFGPLFFTDDVRMTTNLRPNSTFRVPPGITGISSVLMYQAITNSRQAPDVSSELDYVNFTVTTTPESGVDCVPAALGLATPSLIQDCQITASRDSQTEAFKGRYNAATAWTPFVHSGKVSEERYFQVHFGNKTVVNSVHLQQDGPAMATSITIRHSDDGVAWLEDSVNVVPVDSSLNDQELAIPNPKPSRYIRIMMTELTGAVQNGAFRFELTGCHVTNDAPADLCSTSAPSILSDFNSRTFLATSTAVYVCDGRQGNLDIEQRCIVSPDGTSWAEIDPRVGAMVGYDSAEPRVYAVSSDGVVHMSSTDGSQWETSVPDDVTKAKALLTFKSAIVVPLVQDSNLELPDPHTSYIDGIYGATSVGLKKDTGLGWDTVCSWSSCCQ